MMQKCGALFFLLWTNVLLSFGANAEQYCRCEDMLSSSYSDAGTCVVREHSPQICTLDWRTSQGSPGSMASQREENASAFLRTFLGAGGWQGIGDAATEIESRERKAGQEMPLTGGASAYLEQTEPSEYEPDMALASILLLMGSVDPPLDDVTIRLIASYVDSPERVAVITDGLSGGIVDAPSVETSGNKIVGIFAYGCLEFAIYLSDGGELIIAVRTPYAEDEACGA